MIRRSVLATVSAVRIARVATHLVRGLSMASTRFARLTPAAQHRELEQWSHELLSILRVRLSCHNAPESLPARCLVVLNHVSWLDVFGIFAVLPCQFVAKSEVRDWPLVGRLTERVGTLFIERGNRRHAQRTNGRIVEALMNARLIAVCPEGATTDGRALKHFHAALLQPAIDADAMVLPVAVRYLDHSGAQTDAAAYVDGVSLLQSLWRIARSPLTVELRFAAPIEAHGLKRRELADAAKRVIAHELGLPAPDKEPETPGGLLAVPPTARRPTHSPYPVPVDPA